MVIANNYENLMVSIRAIESLHRLTTDIARIINLAPCVAGYNSAKYSQYPRPPTRDVSRYLSKNVKF